MKPSQKLFSVTHERNIPLSIIFELTKKCNLSCLHCYLGDERFAARPELSTARICRILDELADAGALNLVFTGGEIFLRDDILTLCRHARRRSFNLTLFTNGTLLTDGTIRALSDMSVGKIEISLYGKKETHDAVTRLPGSFASSVAAIRTLRARGLPVAIKCPLMSLNIRDYPWLKSFAKDNSLILKLDPTISPRNSGEKDILCLRLDETHLRMIYRDPDFIETDDGSADDFFCSAGRNLAAIDAYGTVYPCLQALQPWGNLLEQPFASIWNNANPAAEEFRNISFGDLTECPSCRLMPVCRRCPGLAALEDGDILGPSRIACTVARVQEEGRRKALSQGGSA